MPGSRSQEAGAERRAAPAREREQDHRDRDAGAADHQPAGERGVVGARVRLADDQEHGEAGGDDQRAHPLDAADVALGDHARDREREHDRGHEQRLHDDHAPDPERDRLRDEAEPLGQEAEQPDGALREPHQEPGADRALRLRGRGLLLEHQSEGEEEGRDERDDDVHARSLSVARAVSG